MHLQGKPVCSFDPEGLIFAAGINSEMVKLYDLRSFDKVRGINSLETFFVFFLFRFLLGGKVLSGHLSSTGSICNL